MRKLLFLLFPLVSFGQTIVNDGKPIEVSTRFTAPISGSVNGVKFFKGSDAGTYVVSLWDATGKKLNSNTITGSSGWVTVPITSTPILPGVTYSVSYYSPNGNYAAKSSYFTTPVTTDVTETGGYYLYSAGFPINQYLKSYYYIDPVFSGNRDTIYLHDTTTLFVHHYDTLTVRDTIWSMQFDSSFVPSMIDAVNNPLPFDVIEFTIPGGGTGRFHREFVWIREKWVNGQWVKWQ